MFAIVTGVSLVEASSMLAESSRSVLLRTHFLFALAIFFVQLILFVINHNYPDRGWDAPAKNYQAKKAKKDLSLSLSSLSEAIEHAPFFLYALIDKKKIKISQ